MASPEIAKLFKAAKETNVTFMVEAVRCLSERRFRKLRRLYVQRAFMRCNPSSACCAQVQMILLEGAEEDWLGELVTARDWDTCLHHAAAQGNCTVVSAILDRVDAAAELARRNGEGFTPLHMAASNGHGDVVELLIPLMKEADIAGENGAWTPLHLALKSGSFKSVEVLLEHLSDDQLEYAAPTRDTALHLATSNSRLRELELLLPRLSDAAVVALGRRSCPALFEACIFGEECLHLFFKYVKDYTLFNTRGQGRTYMHNITYSDDCDLLDVVFQYLSDDEIKEVMNLRCCKGRDAIFEGARRGSVETLARLLPLAELEVFLHQDFNGDTLLHAAINHEFTETVQLVLEFVPNHMLADIVDDEGLPVRAAAESHPDIAKLFNSQVGAKNACS